MLETIKVLLVDDHALVRESLGMTLSQTGDMEVVGSASNAQEAIDLALKVPADMIIMDIDMPGLICFDAAKRLATLRPGLKLVFLSAFFHDRYIEQALSVGAKGYLTKNEPHETLLDAVRKIARGGVHFSGEVWDRLVIEKKGLRLASGGTSKLSSLTSREVEVLRYLARGLSKKEIGQTMHIALKTVEVHTSNIMRKLDIHDRVEIARYAIREGMVEP